MIKKNRVLLHLFLYFLVNLYAHADISSSSPDQTFYYAEETQDTNIIDKKSTLFNINFGTSSQEVSLIGYWKVYLGLTTGFSLNPDFSYNFSVPGYTSGVLFSQQKLLSIDTDSGSGLKFHFFMNDNPEETEFILRYDSNSFFRGFYFANKIESTPLSPYRNLENGRAEDFMLGIKWGNNYYRGRFDIKFDSVKTVTDTFKGSLRNIDGSTLSNKYLRGVYYYLPDKNISGSFDIYIEEENGEEWSDIPSSVTSIKRKYIKLNENSDYILDKTNGKLTFLTSVYKRSVLVNYNTLINGKLYETGDIKAGRNGILTTTDCSATETPEYFVKHGTKTYLILNSYNTYTPFEIKNSYLIGEAGSDVKNLNLSVKDNFNNIVKDFSFEYDIVTGAVIIYKTDKLGDVYNIYPFYTTANPELYTGFASPSDSLSKNIINYSGYMESGKITLTETPITGTMTVRINSILTTDYSYNVKDNYITINKEISDSDIIEVSYLSSSSQNYNLTFAQKNEIRLNKFLLLTDSFYFKMPIKLWEDSYYFKAHSGEFLYSAGITADFKKYLTNKSTGYFDYTLSGTASLFLPDLKGTTLIEDFEYEKSGKTLSLQYKNFYPTDIPSGVFADLAAADTGYMFYRNYHKDSISGSKMTSIYDSSPSVDSGIIGPYSSSDGFGSNSSGGFVKKKNSLSLVTEFALAPGEASSISIPLSDGSDSYDTYSALSMLIDPVKLSGNVRIYVDGGQTAETFLTNTSLLTESSDRGIKYELTAKGLSLTKGKNDGVTTTNDLDSNGTITGDNLSGISRFLYLNEDSVPGNYYEVSGESTKVITYKIEDQDKFKNPRALRLTFYNPDTVNPVNAKIVINQLRFIESFWTYDQTKNSTAEEIFPAEDPVLKRNIFSKEKSGDDANLHYNRTKERSLVVRLSALDGEFSMTKTFSSPPDLSRFKTFSFYCMKEFKGNEDIVLITKDIHGNKRDFTFHTEGHTAEKWHKLTINTSELGSASQLREMTIKIINNSLKSNRIFFDEFYMTDSVPHFGYGVLSDFRFYDPQINIKAGNFSILKDINFSLRSEFNSEDFLKTEFNPEESNTFNNKGLLAFELATVKHQVSSYLNFLVNSSGFYYRDEKLLLSLSKEITEKNPAGFKLSYDFTKNYLNEYSEIKRETLSEVKFALLPVISRLSFKSYNTRTASVALSSELLNEFALSFENISLSSSYLLVAGGINKNLDYGDFSVDNIRYAYSEDIPGFIGLADKHSGIINLGISAKLLPILYSQLLLTFNDTTRLSSAKFISDNAVVSEVLLNFSLPDDDFTLFRTGYKRTILNSRTINYAGYWENFFQEEINSYYINSSLVLLTPFSSTYRNFSYDTLTKFGSLTDELSLKPSWQKYLSPIYYLPHTFEFKFSETMRNLVNFTKEYTFTFILTSLYSSNFSLFPELRSETITSFSITFAGISEIIMFSNTSDVSFLLFNDLKFKTAAMYSFNYKEEEEPEYVKTNVTVSLNLYKSFFKEDLVNNTEYGFETDFTLSYGGIFYYSFDKEPEISDTPANIQVIPYVGYKFNSHMKVGGELSLGYLYSRDNVENTETHNFVVQLTISGELTF